MANGTLLESRPVSLPEQALSMAERSMSADDYSRYASISLHDITYLSDGLKIKGWLALPPAGNSTYPAIVFNRGGIGPRGALSAEGAMQIIGRYASWGYVVVSSNYRGVGGSEGEHEEWGGNDVDDALACLDLLDGLGYVDMDRLGLVGGSRGGMMAFMMLAQTNRFRAAITFGAPTMIHKQQAHEYIHRTMKKHLAPDSIVLKEAERRSVVAWPEKLSKTTPLLVLHGTGDRRVPPEHALQLASQLQELEHPYKLVMYDNADHVLAGRRDESNNDIRVWLDRYVRDKSSLPKTGPFGA